MAKNGTHTVQITACGRLYEFHLNHKLELFGDVEVDHFWIPTPLLNPKTEPAPTSTFGSVCNGYRAIYLTEPSDLKLAAETYIFARLLPYTRKRGAMSVFQDAKEHPGIHKSMNGNDGDLQSYLERDPLLSMTVTDFQDSLRKLQKLQLISDPTQNRYREIADGLLDGLADGLVHDPEFVFSKVLERWNALKQSFGRRANCAVEKTVLDWVSYESAAAFRRCYSAVWSGFILPTLQKNKSINLSPHSYRFLEYWHQLVLFVNPNNTDDRRYPLLGHCFGLHPATGRLLKTEKGRQLVGEWLQTSVKLTFGSETEKSLWIADLPNQPEFGRLLRGFLIAYHHYANQLYEANANRPSRKTLGDTDVGDGGILDDDECHVPLGGARRGRAPRHNVD